MENNWKRLSASQRQQFKQNFQIQQYANFSLFKQSNPSQPHPATPH
jgi:hypothetical protein